MNKKTTLPLSHPAVLPSSEAAYDELAGFRRNVSMVQSARPAQHAAPEEEEEAEYREVGDEAFARARLKNIAARLKAQGLEAADAHERKELLYGANLFFQASLYAPSFTRQGLVRANI